jgi:hypothetical protein
MGAGCASVTDACICPDVQALATPILITPINEAQLYWTIINSIIVCSTDKLNSQIEESKPYQNSYHVVM